MSNFEKIKTKIESIKFTNNTYSEGIITNYSDGIASASGLKGVGFGEVVKIYEKDDETNFTSAIVFNLEEEVVGLIVLEENLKIKTGSKVISTGEIFSVKASEELLGRNINILGEALDGLGQIHHKNASKQIVDKKASGVIDRQPVEVPLQTGIIAVDALIPIGRGQRELIIGDRQTGKTSLALDVIINQGLTNKRIESGEVSGKKIYSIYVAIGQKKSKIAQLTTILKEFDVLKYTVIVTAGASEQAASQYLAPYVGTAIGEYFMEKGDDALIIYDDLSKHAKAYRQISLLLRRPPGREAYPGDVFYLHSRLLERSARLSEQKGGGSLTALPIIETLASDVSAYIPTNVISITDGQIYLKSELFNQGVKPAVDVGLSVSRVGGSAQIKAMKQVAGTLKLKLAQFRELQAFAQFGVEMDAATQKRIDEGNRLTEILKQNLHSPLSVEEQIVLIWAVTKGYADSIELNQTSSWGKKYLEFMRDFHSTLLSGIIKEKKITEEIEQRLEEATKEFSF